MNTLRPDPYEFVVTEINDSGHTIYSFRHNDMEYGWFNDGDCLDCPEDLTWSRTIGHLYACAFNMGYDVGYCQALDDLLTVQKHKDEQSHVD